MGDWTTIPRSVVGKKTRSSPPRGEKSGVGAGPGEEKLHTYCTEYLIVSTLAWTHEQMHWDYPKWETRTLFFAKFWVSFFFQVTWSKRGSLSKEQSVRKKRDRSDIKFQSIEERRKSIIMRVDHSRSGQPEKKHRRERVDPIHILDLIQLAVLLHTTASSESIA